MTATTQMISISLRYTDAMRMYDYLIEASGLEKHAAFYSDDGRTRLPGELRMGSSFVMLGSAEGNTFGKLHYRCGATATQVVKSDAKRSTWQQNQQTKVFITSFCKRIIQF